MIKRPMNTGVNLKKISAQRAFLNLLDRSDAGTQRWYQSVSMAAIAAGLPFFDSRGELDLGAAGWRAWAAAAIANLRG
jgi:hypothetical protein